LAGARYPTPSEKWGCGKTPQRPNYTNGPPPQSYGVVRGRLREEGLNVEEKRRFSEK